MDKKEKKEEGPKHEVDTLTNTTEVIKLVSKDEKVFFVNKDIVEISKHLKTSLSSSFIEGKTREVKLDIHSDILEITIKYLHHKIIYRDLPHDVRPQFHVDPPKALDVLNAAIYLECWTYFS